MSVNAKLSLNELPAINTRDRKTPQGSSSNKLLKWARQALSSNSTVAFSVDPIKRTRVYQVSESEGEEKSSPSTFSPLPRPRPFLTADAPSPHSSPSYSPSSPITGSPSFSLSVLSPTLPSPPNLLSPVTPVLTQRPIFPLGLNLDLLHNSNEISAIHRGNCYLDVIRSYISEGEFEKAQQYCNEIQNSHQQLNAIIAIAKGLHDRGLFKEVDQWIASAKGVNPHTLYARLYCATGNLEMAEKHVLAQPDENSKELLIKIIRAHCDPQRQNLDQATRILNQMIASPNRLFNLTPEDQTSIVTQIITQALKTRCLDTAINLLQLIPIQEKRRYPINKIMIEIQGMPDGSKQKDRASQLLAQSLVENGQLAQAYQLVCLIANKRIKTDTIVSLIKPLLASQEDYTFMCELANTIPIREVQDEIWESIHAMRAQY